MAEQRATDLIERGNRLFSKRAPLLSLWQDMAENFYVERATFTTTRSIGDDFAGHLTDATPIRARQELANAVGGMLRPAGREWFRLDMGGGVDEKQSVREALDVMAERQRAFMYENGSGFTRATKEGDNDYVAFGNACISVEPDFARSSVLYRCWHLRDVVWSENAYGMIDEIHREWKPTVQDLKDMFGDKVHDEIARTEPKDRYREVECRKVVIPAERYGKIKTNHRYVGIVIDVENGHVMEEVGQNTLRHVIPRWQTVSDSQYGYSQATVAAIPDARMLQDMARTIIEAGEKAVDPPMLATQEVVKSDLDFAAGGVSWVDAQYDERLGAAIRPISQDRSGLPITLDMQRDLREQIAAAMMLNKLTLPAADTGSMTAYEVGQRVQEYIRSATPLFEPIEADYNGALCSETFNILMENGAFGSPADWPEEMQTGGDIDFKFQNPFTAATSQEAISQFQAVGGLLSQQVQYDPAATAELDTKRMFREAIKGTGAPSDWLNTEDEAAKGREQMEEEQDARQAMEQAAQAGATAEQVGKGVSEMAGAAA